MVDFWGYWLNQWLLWSVDFSKQNADKGFSLKVD